MHVFSFCCLFSPLENGISGKHIIVLYLQLLNTKIYPFQYLSLGFILKIFLKFCEFQPWYSYKIYSYRKKKSLEWELKGHPRCNIIYSFSLSCRLLSGLGSLLRMFCFLCVTSAVSSKLYYTRSQPNCRGINKGLALSSFVLLFMYDFQCPWRVFLMILSSYTFFTLSVIQCSPPAMKDCPKPSFQLSR